MGKKKGKAGATASAEPDQRRRESSLAVKAPARLAVLAPQSGGQENFPLALAAVNYVGHRKSNKNRAPAGPAAVGAAKVGD